MERYFSRHKAVLILAHVLLVAQFSLAETKAPANTASVRVMGRESAVVTTSEVRLGDVADVSSSNNTDDEVVIGLKRVVIAESPAPGEKINIGGAKILERLRAQGIELKQIGYSLARNISVERAARTLSKEEVIQQINKFLLDSGRDINLRELNFSEEVQIAPGEAEFKLSSFETGRNGELGFNIEARVEDAPVKNFKLVAQVDEWRELPVASRAMSRGSVIGPSDYAMARMNIAQVSRNSAAKIEDVLGKEVVQNIASGEAFALNKLNIPPVIRAGSKVTMLYRSKLLEASASGIALEDAIPGQTLKVRNENSKKVIFGVAREEGLVEVKP